MQNSELTLPNIERLFNYNNVTGKLSLKVDTRLKKAGFVYEKPTTNGYISVTIGRKSYMAHRVIWLLSYKSLPLQIDHIDGDKTNNRLNNLRSVACVDNSRNMGITTRNLSGVVGVSWCKTHKKWVAFIGVNNKMITLGRFSNKEEAIDCRTKAEITYDFHPNHGKRITLGKPNTLKASSTITQQEAKSLCGREIV